MPTWADVKAATADLPEVVEGTMWGKPCLRVRKDMFVRLRDEGQTLVVRVIDEEDKEAPRARGRAPAAALGGLEQLLSGGDRRSPGSRAQAAALPGSRGAARKREGRREPSRGSDRPVRARPRCRWPPRRADAQGTAHLDPGNRLAPAPGQSGWPDPAFAGDALAVARFDETATLELLGRAAVRVILRRFSTDQVLATAPFTVPAGTWRKVPVPLDAAALAAGREEGGWAVDADVPGGRVGPGGRGAAELSLKE